MASSSWGVTSSALPSVSFDIEKWNYQSNGFHCSCRLQRCGTQSSAVFSIGRGWQMWPMCETPIVCGLKHSMLSHDLCKCDWPKPIPRTELDIRKTSIAITIRLSVAYFQIKLAPQQHQFWMHVVHGLRPARRRRRRRLSWQNTSFVSSIIQFNSLKSNRCGGRVAIYHIDIPNITTSSMCDVWCGGVFWA